jgi:hypothetical protein
VKILDVNSDHPTKINTKLINETTIKPNVKLIKKKGVINFFKIILPVHSVPKSNNRPVIIPTIG